MKPPKGGPAHSFCELQASNQVDVRLMAELRPSVSLVPSTNTLDFMAIWIYLVLFSVFNCIRFVTHDSSDLARN